MTSAVASPSPLPDGAAHLLRPDYRPGGRADRP